MDDSNPRPCHLRYDLTQTRRTNPSWRPHRALQSGGAMMTRARATARPPTPSSTPRTIQTPTCMSTTTRPRHTSSTANLLPAVPLQQPFSKVSPYSSPRHRQNSTRSSPPTSSMSPTLSLPTRASCRRPSLCRHRHSHQTPTSPRTRSCPCRISSRYNSRYSSNINTSTIRRTSNTMHLRYPTSSTIIPLLGSLMRDQRLSSRHHLNRVPGLRIWMASVCNNAKSLETSTLRIRIAKVMHR